VRGRSSELHSDARARRGSDQQISVPHVETGVGEADDEADLERAAAGPPAPRISALLTSSTAARRVPAA
jgi:hypothetical protein